MKVLSIKEPFATLIKDGVKIYETRSWKTNYRGELYIHASLAISKSDNASSGRASKHLKSEIKPGYILCRCNLVDCIPMTEDFINMVDRLSQPNKLEKEIIHNKNSINKTNRKIIKKI